MKLNKLRWRLSGVVPGKGPPLLFQPPTLFTEGSSRRWTLLSLLKMLHSVHWLAKSSAHEHGLDDRILHRSPHAIPCDAISHASERPAQTAQATLNPFKRPGVEAQV